MIFSCYAPSYAWGYARECGCAFSIISSHKVIAIIAMGSAYTVIDTFTRDDL